MAAPAMARFEQVVGELAGAGQAVRATAFGRPGLKRGGKMCACLPDDEGMAFRLLGPAHSRAMALAGAHLWDPSGRGRPFRDWVYVPVAHAGRWSELAAEAVRSLDAG